MKEFECQPKIISYFIDYHNDNFSYNCELCDNMECVHYKEFNEVVNDN